MEKLGRVVLSRDDEMGTLKGALLLRGVPKRHVPLGQ